MSEKNPAALLLEDGSFFEGWSCGADGTNVGEICFNTAMIGYPEVVVDPYYAGKIVTMTYPQIGNYGVCLKDLCEQKPQIVALVVSDMCDTPSSFRSDIALGDYLREHKVVAIEGIDTRMLVRRIRENPTQRAIVSTENINKESLLLKLQPQLQGSTNSVEGK